MVKFDSADTEKYFYEGIRKLGYTHVLLSDEKIYTIDDIYDILNDLEESIKKYGI